MNYIGIDPGLSGAIAIIRDGVAEIFDPPTVWVAKAKNRRRQYVLSELLQLLRLLAGPRPEEQAAAAIEQAMPMPRQGVTSTFSTGYGFGLYIMALTALAIPYDLVRPQRWKAAMLEGVSKGKHGAYLQAQRLFPGVELGSRSDHGRAEALLIAEWRRRQG